MAEIPMNPSSVEDDQELIDEEWVKAKVRTSLETIFKSPLTPLEYAGMMRAVKEAVERYGCDEITTPAEARAAFFFDFYGVDSEQAFDFLKNPEGNAELRSMWHKYLRSVRDKYLEENK